MKLNLLHLEFDDFPVFKKDMQEAFQLGAASEFEKLEDQILSEADIDSSLKKDGAVAYKALIDGKIVGGAIVVIDEISNRNHIDFLYVKNGVHSRGIGQKIWQTIEKMHPKTRIWETYTPYFEKRNIHFYINRCGFVAVEFYNPHHKDPKIPNDMIGGDYFFRFEKTMK